MEGYLVCAEQLRKEFVALGEWWILDSEMKMVLEDGVLIYVMFA